MGDSGEIRYCTQCGTPVPGGEHRFCTSCGSGSAAATPWRAADAPAMPSPTPEPPDEQTISKADLEAARRAAATPVGHVTSGGDGGPAVGGAGAGGVVVGGSSTSSPGAVAWAPVWDERWATWIEPAAGLRLDPASGAWVPLAGSGAGTAAGVGASLGGAAGPGGQYGGGPGIGEPGSGGPGCGGPGVGGPAGGGSGGAAAPSIARRAGRGWAGLGDVGRVGLLGLVLVVVVLAGDRVTGQVSEWLSDATGHAGAEDISAGECFSPGVSEMITASFDVVDCTDAEPFVDMRVLWTRQAGDLSEVNSIAWECSGIPYTPSDQETFDATDGTVVCAEVVTGSSTSGW